MSIMSVSQVKQLSVGMSNVPGSLAKAAQALADAGVNVEGMSQNVGGGSGMQNVHFVTSQTDAAKEAFKSQGLECTEEQVLAVDSSDEPGILAQVASALGDAGINIENLYVTTPGDSKHTVMFVGVKSEDLAKATKALSALKS